MKRETNKPIPLNLTGLLAVVSLALVSCGTTNVTEVAPERLRITSTGFECPEPEFPMEVTSKELNIYVWTERISLDMQECFELIYDVKVHRDEYSSNERMYEKLSAGDSNYDLVQPTDYIVALLIRQGLLQELEHGRLPVLKNFDQNYLDFEFDPGNKYTIPYLIGTEAIVVNSAAVENVPQSWADLWNPEYAGRMVFLDEMRATIGLTLLALGYDVNTTDPAQLGEAEQKLAELIPKIKIFDSDSPSTALIAAEVDLGMTRTGEAFIAQQGNPAIQYIYPAEGAILWQDNWAMPAKAQHVDAAYAWLNYTMQADIFWMLLRDWPYTNPNKAALDFAKGNQTVVHDRSGGDITLAELYDDYMASSITNVPADAIKAGHRIADVGEAAALYNDIWVRVKGGQ